MSTPASVSMSAEQLAAVRGLLNDPAVSITLDGRGWLRAITPVPPIVVFGGLVVIPQTPREALLFDPFLPARVEPDGARLREAKRAARHARYVAEARAEHAAWRAEYRARREAEGEVFPEEIDPIQVERERAARRLRRRDRRRGLEQDRARDRGDRPDPAEPEPRPRIAPDDPPEAQFVG